MPLKRSVSEMFCWWSCRVRNLGDKGLGFGVSIERCRVYNLGSRVKGLGFRVQGPGRGIQGLRFRV